MVDMQGRLIGKRFQAEFFCRRRTRGNPRLRLSARRRHRHGAGAGLRGGELGQGLWRFRHEARHDDAAPPAVARRHRAGARRRARPSPRGRAAFAARDAQGARSRGSKKQKMRAYCASELEFYLFDESYEAIHAKRYHEPKTAGYYIEDYHILQTTKEEGVMRAIRRGLQGAGIPVENSKGEWGPGQEEINVRYSDALDMADNHVDPEERREGDRARPGQGRHLHVEMELRPRGLVVARAHLAVGRGRQDAAVLRREGRVHDVAADALVRGGATRTTRATSHISSRPISTPTSASRSAPSRRPRRCGAATTARRGSGCAGRAARRSASNAASAAPTSIRIWRSRR